MSHALILPITSPNAPFKRGDFPVLSSPRTKEITRTIQDVLQAKKGLVQKAKVNKWERYNPILIGGDLFSFGYLAFQGTLSLAPKLSNIPAIGMATLVCGEIAGLINIGVGFVCLKEGLQALENGDTRGGIRLLLDFSCCIVIGLIMILASLAIRVTALASVSAFFTANPWLLPLIFFIATLPLIVDLGSRIKEISQSTNLGSKLQLDTLETLLAKNDWEGIEKLCKNPDHPLYIDPQSKTDVFESISNKMEQLQADMGVSAATAVFNLMLTIQKKDREAAQKNLRTARKKIEAWNRSIYVRMFQQMLFVGGFGVSMAALSPSVNGELLGGIQNYCLSLANAIPLYMDIFWPFKRNQLIVVPKVEFSELITRDMDEKLA